MVGTAGRRRRRPHCSHGGLRHGHSTRSPATGGALARIPARSRGPTHGPSTRAGGPQEAADGADRRLGPRLGVRAPVPGPPGSRRGPARAAPRPPSRSTTSSRAIAQHPADRRLGDGERTSRGGPAGRRRAGAAAPGGRRRASPACDRGPHPGRPQWSPQRPRRVARVTSAAAPGGAVGSSSHHRWARQAAWSACSARASFTSGSAISVTHPPSTANTCCSAQQ